MLHVLRAFVVSAKCTDTVGARVGVRARVVIVREVEALSACFGAMEACRLSHGLEGPALVESARASVERTPELAGSVLHGTRCGERTHAAAAGGVCEMWADGPREGPDPDRSTEFKYLKSTAMTYLSTPRRSTCAIVLSTIVL